MLVWWLSCWVSQTFNFMTHTNINIFYTRSRFPVILPVRPSSLWCWFKVSLTKPQTVKAFKFTLPERNATLWEMLLYLYRNLGLVHCVFFQLQSIASTSPLVSHFISIEAPETCKSRTLRNFTQKASVNWDYSGSHCCAVTPPLSFLSLSDEMENGHKRNMDF